MAIRDFREYLIKVRNQYLEAQADLKDFEQALKDGHITEEQLEGIKEELQVIETNYRRLAYTDYLICLPNRKAKQAGFRKSTKELQTFSEKMKSADSSVYAENENALRLIKEDIARLKNTTGK